MFKLFQCALQLSQSSCKMRRKILFLNLSPAEPNTRADHCTISRITEWLRLERSLEGISPNLPVWAGQLRACYPKPCISRWLWNSSKDGDSKTSVQPVLVLDKTHRKNVSWCSARPSCVQFVSTACPVTGHHWKEPGSVFFTATLQRFIDDTSMMIYYWWIPSIFPHMRWKITPYPSLWCFTGLSPVCPASASTDGFKAKQSLC